MTKFCLPNLDQFQRNSSLCRPTSSVGFGSSGSHRVSRLWVFWPVLCSTFRCRHWGVGFFERRPQRLWTNVPLPKSWSCFKIDSIQRWFSNHMMPQSFPRSGSRDASVVSLKTRTVLQYNKSNFTSPKLPF